MVEFKKAPVHEPQQDRGASSSEPGLLDGLFSADSFAAFSATLRDWTGLEPINFFVYVATGVVFFMIFRAAKRLVGGTRGRRASSSGGWDEWDGCSDGDGGGD